MPSSNNTRASDGNKHTDARLIADNRAERVAMEGVVGVGVALVLLLLVLPVFFPSCVDMDHCNMDLMKRRCWC